MLSVAVEHRLGDFRLDAAFDSEGGLTALFGRSGAGKTSLVNAIAGLIRPARGHIVIDGTVLTDSERGIFVPTRRRRVGYVFQEGRLFPHLTVRQNLLYGRWFARRFVKREPSRPGEVEHVIDLLGIGDLLARRPANLSGGEKQRVAIGRALLAHPRLLVMDEPLASLDEARKAEILPYIERLRDETRIPIVYVSHQVAEVATLRAAAGDLRVPYIDMRLGTRLRVRIRARDVMIALSPPDGLSALNVLPGIVAEVGRADGPIVEIRLDCAGEALVARLTRRSVETLGLEPGREVYAVIKSIAFDHHALAGAMPAAPGADAETRHG
jgi:molybdate transport system ATP-binding protein